MESETILLAALAALAGAVIAALFLRRERNGAAIGELAARLKQLTEQQEIAQSQLSQRLQAQERAVSESVEKRLGDMGQRLSESLAKSSQLTQETMGDLKSRLAVIDAAQTKITELSTQVVSLQDILANKQARGAFGEIQLQDLVENVLPPSAYALQAPLGDGKRVDCLLKLPNPPGPIAVDAKFPLESYNALRAAKDDAALVAAQRAFTLALRTHIAAIADKYIIPGETAESALMFLPSEAVYAELHANFAAVVEESYRRRVFIVSPTTLWAMLNTLRAVLKDVRMREQASVIQREVTILLDDIRRLDERVGKLQRHIGQTTDDIREIRTSTEKIQKRGERIESLELDEPIEAASDTLPGPRRIVS
ncbi:MAG: DNA recombination protein RmuC [Alphaproteobacteria bacterium]